MAVVDVELELDVELKLVLEVERDVELTELDVEDILLEVEL